MSELIRNKEKIMSDMYYESDKPIISSEEDVLGRVDFSKNLANALYNQHSKDGLVIGVYGQWGSGKTSLINMAIEEMKNNDVMVIRFEPWNYSDKNDLIIQFFNLVKQSLEVKDYSELKEAIGDGLEEYIDCLDGLNAIPYLGGLLSFISKRRVRKVIETLRKKDSLEKIKEKLEEALKNQNTRIIVVIDDIDRLSAEQIQDIIQLVKSVGAFSNITYVLLMDRLIVERALDNVQKVDGRRYLEKIIQIPIEIPQANIGHVYNYFFTQLNSLLKLYKVERIDELYWNLVFSDCIRPFIRNIRDVKRILNVLSFKISMVIGEVSVEDTIAITVIGVMEPVLYRWIIENKNILCGRIINSSLINAADSKNEEKSYYDYFDKLISTGQISYLADANEVLSTISTLFPVFANRLGKFINVYDDGEELIRKMRISNPDRFDIYFRYDLNGWSFTRKDLESIIAEKGESEISAFMDKMQVENSLTSFLGELKALDANIPKERRSLFMHLMLLKQMALVREENGELFKNTDRYNAERIFDDLFKEIDSKQKFEFLKNEIITADCGLLEGIGVKLSELLGAYGLLEGRNENPDKQLMVQEDVESLREMYMHRIRNLCDKNEIWIDCNIEFMEYIWLNTDETSYKIYLRKQMNDKKIFLRYLCRRTGTWSSVTGRGYTLDESQYNEFISKKELIEIIKNYDAESFRNDFDDIQRVKLASVVLNENRDDFYKVSEEDAKKWVEEKINNS